MFANYLQETFHSLFLLSRKSEKQIEKLKVVIKKKCHFSDKKQI